MKILPKILNVTIEDTAHEKLKRIKRFKGFDNNVATFEYLINEVHENLFGDEK